MKKKMKKKLTLNRETLRNLSDAQLGKVAGGTDPTDFCRTHFGCASNQTTCPTVKCLTTTM